MLQKSAHLEGKTTQQICARFFNQKSLANLNYFTLNERANNFLSDGEKLIAVCYSQQKLLLGWQAYRGDQIHRNNSPT